MQQLQRAAVDQVAPDNLSLVDTTPQLARELPSLATKMLHGGRGRTGILEDLKEFPNCVLHLSIRQLDAVQLGRLKAVLAEHLAGFQQAFGPKAKAS